MNYDLWAVLRPSSTGELEQLQTQAYTQAKQCIKEHGKKGKDALKHVLNLANIRKIAYDMYVWQRIDAINLGTEKALNEAV